MPHITLEHSSNIIEENSFVELFKQCHSTIVETISSNLKDCKSKAVHFDDYYIGTGNPDNAFIHLDIKIMAGRIEEKLQLLGKKLMDLLKEHFAKSVKELNLQITIEISDLSKAYFKFVSEE